MQGDARRGEKRWAARRSRNRCRRRVPGSCEDTRRRPPTYGNRRKPHLLRVNSLTADDDDFGIIRNSARGADDMFELSTIHKRLGAPPPSKCPRTGWIGEDGLLARNVPPKARQPEWRGTAKICTHSAKAGESATARFLPAAHVLPRLIEQGGRRLHLVGDKLMQAQSYARRGGYDRCKTAPKQHNKDRAHHRPTLAEQTKGNLSPLQAFEIPENAVGISARRLAFAPCPVSRPPPPALRFPPAWPICRRRQGTASHEGRDRRIACQGQDHQ